MKKPRSYLLFLDAVTSTKMMMNNPPERLKEEKNVIIFKEPTGEKRLVIYTDLTINSGVPPKDAKDGQVYLSLAWTTSRACINI